MSRHRNAANDHLLAPDATTTAAAAKPAETGSTNGTAGGDCCTGGHFCAAADLGRPAGSVASCSAGGDHWDRGSVSSSSSEEEEDDSEEDIIKRLESERQMLLLQINAGTGSRRLRRTAGATDPSAVLQLRLRGIEWRQRRWRDRSKDG